MYIRKATRTYKNKTYTHYLAQLPRFSDRTIEK